MKLQKDHIVEFETGLEVNTKYYLGYDCLDGLISKLSNYQFDRLILVTNREINTLHGANLYKKLKDNYDCGQIHIPIGEENKIFSTLENLCNNLIKKKVSKDSIVISFGGGMVGNVVGLAAALVFRGIRYVEVPTTTIAMTDSVLSNKQAINGFYGKNHFGVYYAPLFIWGDVKLLSTEPQRSINSGLAESVKNGLISDPIFLDYLGQHLNKKTDYQWDLLFELVCKSIASKLEIIKKDPSEKGYGMILEYGHTFGHVIEKLYSNKIFHGEAIAIGMYIAAMLSNRLDYLKNEDVELHRYFIEEKLGIELATIPEIGIRKMFSSMKTDNKKTGDGVKYVLLEKIGKVLNPNRDYLVSVPETVVRSALNNFNKIKRSAVRNAF